MKRRKNSNLHVVREPEDPTDKIIEEIMDELNSEDGVTEKVAVSYRLVLQ